MGRRPGPSTVQGVERGYQFLPNGRSRVLTATSTEGRSYGSGLAVAARHYSTGPASRAPSCRGDGFTSTGDRTPGASYTKTYFETDRGRCVGPPSA